MTRPLEATAVVSRWATKEEVAQHLRVSVKTVQRMTARGDLVAHQVGPRLIRYDLIHIDHTLTGRTGGGIGVPEHA